MAHNPSVRDTGFPQLPIPSRTDTQGILGARVGSTPAASIRSHRCENESGSAPSPSVMPSVSLLPDRRDARTSRDRYRRRTRHSAFCAPEPSLLRLTPAATRRRPRRRSSRRLRCSSQCSRKGCARQAGERSSATPIQGHHDQHRRDEQCPMTNRVAVLSIRCRRLRAVRARVAERTIAAAPTDIHSSVGRQASRPRRGLSCCSRPGPQTRRQNVWCALQWTFCCNFDPARRPEISRRRRSPRRRAAMLLRLKAGDQGSRNLPPVICTNSIVRERRRPVVSQTRQCCAIELSMCTVTSTRALSGDPVDIGPLAIIRRSNDRSAGARQHPCPPVDADR